MEAAANERRVWSNPSLWLHSFLSALRNVRRSTTGFVLGFSSEIAQFMTFFSDVDDGDEMRFDYAPDTGLTYSHNGEARGTIAGAEFGRAFFLVFVGAQPPSAALKAGLLGGRCD